MLQNDNYTPYLPPVEQDEFGFTVLNYGPFLHALYERESHELKTPALAAFISTLGRNKSGSENSIGRFQYFANAFIEEASLHKCNQKILAFVGDDHYNLIRGATGTNDPDFYFYAKNGRTFTIEVKMYWSEESYRKELPNTNFHNADYCIAFLISTKQWVFSRRIDGYSKLCSASYFTNTDPWLLEITLPEKLTTIKIYVPELDSIQFSRLTNEQLVEKYPVVNYSFFTNYVGGAYV